MADAGDVVGYVKDVLMDILVVVGLGMGGGQAAAAAELLILQQDSLKTFTPTPLAPSQAAVAVVKGHISEGQGAGQAEKAGMASDVFGVLVESTGNPPGPQELLAMWRRGILSADGVAEGLKEGYTAPKWISSILSMRPNLLSVAELVAAVVQNQMGQGEGAADAGKLGYDGEQFDLMVRTAGDPPGPGQALDMARRGIIDQGQLEQALRESRLKNKWIPAFLQLQERRIPMRTITTLLNHHAIDDGTARRYLSQLGYSDADANALIASSKYTAAKANHDLTIAQVRALYTERVLSRDQAVAAMVKAGYAQETAGQILSLADVQANHHIQNQAVTQIRGRYVGHKLTRQQASLDLDGIGIGPDQRDYLLSVWDYERAAAQATLTLAQLEQAAKKDVISTEDFLSRVSALGYSDSDVAIIAITQGILPNPNAGATGA